MTERPHRMYPRQMKGLRRPTRSERAPMSRVVTVAAMALNATIQAMAVGSGAMALYRNTLKYMFSMVQANWPTRPTRMRAIQVRFFIQLSSYGAG